VFATVFDKPADTFTDDANQDTVAEWTSLRNVSLLVAIENAFGIQFSNAEMTTMRGIGDIRTALQRRGVPVG
jgi:acyl carrier protein